jgi:hypothetical protein
VWVEQRDVRRAWTVFHQYDDKKWSFVDCASYVVMQRLDIKRAFAFDDHFRQFGIGDVVDILVEPASDLSALIDYETCLEHRPPVDFLDLIHVRLLAS